MKKTTRAAAVGTACAALMLLTACAGGEDTRPEQNASASPATGSTESAAAPLTVQDAWTKASESGMTGSFATLENTSDQDVHITGVHSELSPVVELHTMVDDGSGQMVMQEAPDGFTVEAGNTYELAPGGDHVMFMDLQNPLLPGDTVDYVLELEDGSEVEVTGEVRDFAGANESYHGGEAAGSEDSDTGHEGHDHDDMGDGHGDKGMDHEGHDHGDHEGHDH